MKYVFKLSNYTIDPKDETYFALLGICIHQFAQNNILVFHTWYLYMTKIILCINHNIDNQHLCAIFNSSIGQIEL
jgi:hypothetical protein